MARSIDRLIRLARKTGDRLIVHDPNEERDIVIMDLDQYEMLVDAQKDLEEYIDDFQTYRDQFPPVQEVREGKEEYFAEEREVAPERQEISSARPEITTMPQLEEDVMPPFEAYEGPPVSEEEPEDEKDPRGPSMPAVPSEMPTQDDDLPPVKPVSRTSNWTPAATLLEEKFRILTGQAEPRPVAQADLEPRRVPMVTHEDSEQEFDEDDDEPIFLEEPV